MSIAGRLFYLVCHRPLGLVRESLRHGGPIAQARIRKAQREMQVAAANLAPRSISVDANALPLTVHLLTGRRFVYQTTFCLYSLSRHISVPLHPVLYDDGSLTAEDGEQFRRLFPHTQIHAHAALRERLETVLPQHSFPVLRERWINYPHIRKLIDIHAGREGWRLVMDSDVLFWRRPQLLLDWNAKPTAPLHAIDGVETYGYPRPELDRLAGTITPPAVNVGLLGLRSDEVDWPFLEHAAASLIATHGTSYYLEQALSALLIARSPSGAIAAPRADYTTLPKQTEIDVPTAVMHHYVDLTRDAYHTHAWRRVLETRP